MTAPELTPFELDALREIANIGSGHAATVLSKMTGTRIMIDVPTITLERRGDVFAALAGPDRRVVTLAMRMLGDLTGETSFLMLERNAAVLADLLMGRAPGTGGLEEQMEASALREAGNVMAASFLNALSACLSMVLLPSVPEVIFGETGQPATDPSHGDPDEKVLVAVTQFRFVEESLAPYHLRGVFLFALDTWSRQRLFEALRRPIPVT